MTLPFSLIAGIVYGCWTGNMMFFWSLLCICLKCWCYIDSVVMKTGGWFYKDRLGRTRGPLELITLKTAWGAGIIDKHTFIWGEDMDEWAPIHMVYGLEPAIATWEGMLNVSFPPTSLFNFLLFFSFQEIGGTQCPCPLIWYSITTELWKLICQLPFV